MDCLVSPSPPQFEHHETGFGIGHASPRLSWKFATLGPRYPKNWMQKAYELEIIRVPQRHEQIHRVQSNQSVLVPWPWEPLQSREIARVRVRCYGKEDAAAEESATDWSEWSTVECSLLHKEDWTAAFVTSSLPVDAAAPLAPIRFRKRFRLPHNSFPIVRTRLYITALGVYHAFLNGKRIGDHCMAPGWTAYGHRLNYQTFDVSNLLRGDEENVLGVEVGAGWYATRLGFNGGKRCCYGSPDLAVLAQLEVTMENGVFWVLPSNDSWECLRSPIQSSEIYDGEVYDMRCEYGAWSTVDKDEEGLTGLAARIIPWPRARLVSPDAPPVRVVQEIPVARILVSRSGKVILDFGQNLVGKVRIRSTILPRDQQLCLTHAEVLEDGELCTRPLRTAKCTDIVLGSGKELSNWTPAFTFHGFRYIQVDGWPGVQPSLEDFVALVMHTDMPRRGWFACSNTHINSLHKNIIWGMRGNFVSVPTDCPQRDERLGWTGDLQVFANSATYLYNTTGMLSEWLQDLSAEHLEDHRRGIPPLVVPDVLQKAGGSLAQAVWGDAVVIVPDVLHLYSSDTSILCHQYKSMTTWLDQGIPRGPDGLWDPQTWQLGDWLDPTAPPENPKDARTDGVLVADAYLVHITAMLAAMCKEIGFTEDAERYAIDAQRLKKAFAEKYISPQGNIMSNTQTAISLAVCFSQYRNIEQKRTAAASLSRLVRHGKFALSTGFVGTKFIMEALTLTCQPSLAYRMLLNKKCPSWLYPLTQGATTIWERWDSIRPDGSVNPGEMTSFNHYALGSIANWLHTSVGGIAPLEPGWKTIRIRPVVGGALQWAEAQFDGPYGEVKCRWEVRNGEFRMVVQIPPNSKALITLPTEQHTEIGEDGEDGTWMGSGVHEFKCAYSMKEQWPPRPLLGPFERDDPGDIWHDSSAVGQFTMAELLAGRSDSQVGSGRDKS
ncbi:bacterial alpha-L-rhamnosidase-domain-containing protein [Aspergillus granulosus]|uniref:alpha-L-rhamnosidase n=1 Tax=Aspergillus granulosus TaxID=176169 RepID=A0ABR4HA09_9EURO